MLGAASETARNEIGSSRHPPPDTRYERARHNLDRHASYVVTAFVPGAS